MNIDLWILAAAGGFAAIGFYTGAIQQFSHWIGIVAAFLCAKPLAALLAPVLAGRMGWPPGATAIGLSAVSIPVILLVVTLIARVMINAIIPGDQRNMPDRIAGIFLGAGKAVVLAWVVLAAVLAFEEPLARHLPRAEAALNASSAAAFTRKHSLFDAASFSALDKVRAGGDAAALLENPQVKKLLADPGLAKKIRAMKQTGR